MFFGLALRKAYAGPSCNQVPQYMQTRTRMTGANTVNSEQCTRYMYFGYVHYYGTTVLL